MHVIESRNCISANPRYHLGVGITNQTTAVHCPHASKYGGGMCATAKGKRNYKFCTDYGKECNNAGGAYSDCEGVLAGMKDGDASEQAGNTFACRDYHLKAAFAKRMRRAGHVSAANITLHCPHASENGGGVCASDLGKRKTKFCKDFAGTCGAHIAGQDYVNCEAAVGKMPEGVEDVKTGNSFSCREYHLGTFCSAL